MDQAIETEMARLGWDMETRDVVRSMDPWMQSALLSIAADMDDFATWDEPVEV